jgi:cytochrome c556
MRRAALAYALLALSTGAFAAHAAQDIGDEREATMKAIGRSFGEINRMNRGQDAYDGAKAGAALEDIAEEAAHFGTLFEDPKTADKDALPAIWENKADFSQRVAKLSADAKAAIPGAGADEAAFKTAFQTVAPNCGGCHKLYRGE